MPLAIIPNSFLLPLETLKLARLVTSIEEPLEGYHAPPYATLPKPIARELDYAEHDQRSSTASFGSSVTALFSAAFSKRAASQVHIEPQCLKDYALDNSDAWFDEALSHKETQEWIENASIRGRRIYMIVGICTLTDTRFVQTSATEQGIQVEATAPVTLSLAAAGVVVPFATLMDPSAQGKFGSFTGNETQIFAPGEQICAIKYREVKYKWLSSRTLDNSRLSRTRRWCCMKGKKRDAYGDDDEDDEDAIEVEFKDTEDLGNGWTAADHAGGSIYVRS